MLAFAGDIGVGQNHFDAFPAAVVVQFVRDPISQRLRQSVHERRAGSNYVVVPRGRRRVGIGDVPSFGMVIRLQFGARSQQLLAFLGSTETARPLLVHFGARRYAVNGHIQQFSRTDHTENVLDVFEDVADHRTLALGLGAALRMTAWVDYAVHVKIEVVVFCAVGLLTKCNFKCFSARRQRQ